MYEIILASESPRRRQLLENACYKIHIHPVKVSENIEENLNPEAYVTTLSKRKALYFLDTVNHLQFKGKLVIAADTVVSIDSDILGKPENIQQAEEFLGRLSAKTHSVMTGFTIVPDGLWSSQKTYFEETKVRFKTLTRQQILQYISTGEPMDKAGAYAIQGLGAKFVESYDGSWSNVVGLPMEKLEEVFQENGWNVG